MLVPLLNSKMKKKEQEIIDLQETIAYNEKSLLEAAANITELERRNEEAKNAKSRD